MVVSVPHPIATSLPLIANPIRFFGHSADPVRCSADSRRAHRRRGAARGARRDNQGDRGVETGTGDMSGPPAVTTVREPLGPELERPVCALEAGADAGSDFDAAS